MSSPIRFVLRRGNAAFGLIALLVVMAIILFLYFGNAGGGSYSQQVVETRRQGQAMAVRLNTQQLSILIATHRQSTGKLPGALEELEAPPNAFRDPWGQPISFTCEEDRATGGTRVTYRSIGADGQPNTEDDIVQVETLPF